MLCCVSTPIDGLDVPMTAYKYRLADQHMLCMCSCSCSAYASIHPFGKCMHGLVPEVLASISK